MAIPYLSTATLPYGSRVITIGALGYIANNVSADYALNLIERTDELGGPNGVVGLNTAKTGSAQLQLATSAVTIPTVGAEFSMAFQSDGATTFFLTSVGAPEEASSFKVVDVNFRESI